MYGAREMVLGAVESGPLDGRADARDAVSGVRTNRLPRADVAIAPLEAALQHCVVCFPGYGARPPCPTISISLAAASALAGCHLRFTAVPLLAAGDGRTNR